MSNENAAVSVKENGGRNVQPNSLQTAPTQSSPSVFPLLVPFFPGVRSSAPNVSEEIDREAAAKRASALSGFMNYANTWSGASLDLTNSVRETIRRHRTSPNMLDATPQLVPLARLPVEFADQAAQVNELQAKQKYSSSKILVEDPMLKHGLDYDLHQIPLDRLARSLDTKLDVGLSVQEATDRLRRNGLNQLSEPKSDLKWQIVGYLFGGCGMILWPAAILSFLAWRPLGDMAPPPQVCNLALGIVLLIDILIQAGFTAYQDFQSSKVMQNIRKLLPSTVRVIRSGSVSVCRSEQVVVGDVVEFSSGDKIAADLRLIQATQLKVDASALTGESMPAARSIVCTSENPYFTQNLCFFGTSCVEGQGKGIVVSTGDNTVMGRIARTATTARTERTPLSRELRVFMIIFTCLALLFALVCFFVWLGWLKPDHSAYMNTPTMLITMVGVVVAFVPEGLPISLTSAMTIMARRMSKQQVFVKQLSTVETLGSVDIIACDKTGTLTQNKMCVSSLSLAGGNPMPVSQCRPDDPRLLTLATTLSLCNDAKSETETSKFMGNATDIAALHFAEQFLDSRQVRSNYPEVAKVPFSSDKKWMATVHRQQQAGLQPFVLLKGAPERVIEHCSALLSMEAAEEHDIPLDADAKARILSIQESMAATGARVLAICRRRLDDDSSFATPDFAFTSEPPNFPLDGMTLLGLIAINDPPRESSLEAVRAFRKAGIRVMMVTGDHPVTALAIAQQVGIITAQQVQDRPLAIPPGQSSSSSTSSSGIVLNDVAVAQSVHDSDADSLPALVIHGVDIPSFTPEAWDWIFSHKELVFARTTPHQKLTIVQEAQKRNHSVAVTGDGVNDSPALKHADVGVAMGGGSAVAQEAARIVLQDDNIASIVTGIENGRVFFDNLKKVMLYLLPAGEWAEWLPVLATFFIGLQVPLGSYQMIFICICTDVFAELALIYELPESDLMSRPPRPRSQHLVDWRLFLHAFLFVGMIEATVAFFLFFLYFSENGISPSQLVLAFDAFQGEDAWGSWVDPNWSSLPPVSQWPVTTRDQCNCFPGFSTNTLEELLYTGQTIYFVALVVQQFGNLLATRTRTLSIFQHNPFKGCTRNLRLIPAMLCSLACALLITYVPFFNDVFNTRPVPWQYWFYPLVGSLAVFLADEFRKWLLRTRPSCFWSRVAW